MSFITEVKDKIFSVDKYSFDELALVIFRYQAENNPVYQQFIKYLHIKPSEVQKVSQIPFLPISLFKDHKIITGSAEEQKVFESSGTTGSIPSRHYVTDLEMYDRSLLEGFRLFFGEPDDYVFLALLPSYLEREQSSLTYMMQKLMDISGNEGNGFYLYDHDRLASKLSEALGSGKKIFFIGVSFALLDFAEAYHPDLSKCTVVETGGMKGRHKEMIREELHAHLRTAFGVEHILSEYGMTELLSQAYAKENGLFETPPWMRLYIRDTYDPFSYLAPGNSGGINVIDLANINSCSFIATQDLGKQWADGKTEILGRFDHSDIRGCSLMYE